MPQPWVRACFAMALAFAGAARADEAPQAATPAPTANATPAPKRSGDLEDTVSDLQDKLQKLEDESDDQKSELESLNRQMADLKEHGAEGKVHDEYDQPTFWNRLKLHVNTAIRYESQYMGQPAANGLLGNGNSPDVVFPAAPNGSSGMFFKHMGIHLNYKFDDTMTGILHYNFAALEIDKAGVQFNNLRFPPFTSGPLGLDYQLFLGQERQHFGIEQQLDSHETWFPNRAMMYGGHTPFHNALNIGRDAFDFDGLSALALNNLVAELVYEKTMGVHLYHENDLGFLSYSLGFDFVNDEAENSLDGGGTDSLKAGFPLQLTDQDFSEIGRLGLEPKFLNRLLPLGLRTDFGFSAFHDPENQAYYATQAGDQFWADAEGVDGTLHSAHDILTVQGEWVGRNQYGPGYTGSGSTWVKQNAYGGEIGRAEGWYVTTVLQPWRVIDPAAPKVELLARYDTFYYLDMPAWEQLAPYTGSYNAVTVSLKYTYTGNNHTSISYTTYGMNNDFSAVGPSELLQVEQQVNY
jgi:hypothetical protein